MDPNNKKFIKKTNISQFQKLVELMEEYPQLATGSPAFGSSKMVVEETWDSVAKRINSFGPPIRTGLEWRRVWQDQKCRVKKKISGNNKSIHGTGGGPCSVSNLTELELHIDRIYNLSSAAAPGGTVLGLPSAEKTVEITPPRRPKKIAVVTPTSSKQVNVNKNPQMEESLDIFTPNIALEHSYISPIITTEFTQHSQQRKLTSTPQTIKQSLHYNRKRKHLETSNDRLKLVRQQVDIQNKTLKIMQKNAKAAQMQAEAARTQAEAVKDQAEALKEIADSTKLMGQALIDIIKHLKDED